MSSDGQRGADGAQYGASRACETAAVEGARGAWLPVLVALPVYLALVWRFDYLLDDAYIFFRYAVNLANGFGLRFNPAEPVPVEGYSSLLWPVWQAGFVRLGLDLEVWVRVVLLGVGVAFFLHVVRFVRRRLALDPWEATVCALFLAAFPAFAVWSTGGMSDLAHAFAVFAVFERLLGDPARPRGLQAGACALLAVGLRAEGAAFGLLVIAVGFATWWRTRDRALARACSCALAVLVLGVIAHVAWRYAYHGELVSNTMRTKGGTSPDRVLRGLRYSLSYFEVFPGMAFALLAPLAARRHALLRLQAWSMSLGTLGFATLVGGDFMPMGRFFLTGVPFAVVLLSTWLEGGPRRVPKRVAALVATLVSALPAFDLHVVPEAWLARTTSRLIAGSGFVSEYVTWKSTRDVRASWVALGRAIAAHTRPGESLVYPFIGVVGYYTDLHIYDQHCLVTRQSDVGFVWSIEGGDAGHDRYIPVSSFLPVHPTYIGARLIEKGSQADRLWTRESPWNSIAEALYFPLEEPVPGMGEVELELLRATSWDWVGTPFLQLVDVARDLDLSDPVAARAELLRRVAARADELAGAEREIQDDVAAGRLFARREPFGAERLARGERETLGYQVYAWYLPGDGPPHPERNGAVVRSIALDGAPVVDGAEPGWSVVAPGDGHVLDVEGGTVLVVCLRPPRPE